MRAFVCIALMAMISFAGAMANADERQYDAHMKLKTATSVKGVAISLDGQLVAAGTEPDEDPSRIYIWDLQSGKMLHSLTGHESSVWTVSFSPDSKRLVSAGLEGRVHVWDVKSGKRKTTIIPESVGSFRAVFTPDGKSVLVVGQQQFMARYDAATGKQNQFYRPQAGEMLFALAVSADGAVVLGGGRWHVISVFAQATGDLVYAHRAHGGILRTLATSPDNRFYLSGGDDKEIRMWEWGNLQPLKTFSGPNRWTERLSIRGDGKRFVSGGRGSDVFLWDVESGTAVGRLKDEDVNVGDIAISRDGGMVAVGTMNGVNLFKVDDAESSRDAIASILPEAAESVAAATPEPTEAPPQQRAEREPSTNMEIAVGGGEGDHLGNKHALVFGLAKYSVDPLDNPENDARDVASSLERIGFKVQLHLNTDLSAMRLALAEFEAGLPENAVALVYYAGHAVQLEGNSYLVPIGSIAQIETSKDLQRLGLSLSDLVSPLATRKDAISIFILDACRNSPFASIPEITAGLSRGTPVRGMTDITIGSEGNAAKQGMGISGSLIAYSTSPDTVAEDGSGRNSPYTKHLKEELLKPNTSIEEVLKATRLGVTKDTKGRQTPWYESSISGDFYPAGRNRAEFADLLRILVPVDDGMERSEDGSYGYEWSMASGSNSPVEWLHDGYGTAQKENLFNMWGGENWKHWHQRIGEVVITRDGEPTHYGLGKKKEPGKWKITLLGPRSGVSVVTITSDAFADRLLAADILEEEVACRQHVSSTGGNLVYRIRLPGHVFAWLGESFSCGTAGCSADYAVVWSRRDAKELGCP